MANATKAKFICTQKAPAGDGFDIRLDAVTADHDPNSENSRFFRYPPGGVVRLSVVSQAAAEVFTVGKEVYGTFEPVAVTAPGEPAAD